MAQQATPQSLPPVSALPATISAATESCSFNFVASSSFSSTKKGRVQLLVASGCSSHVVDPEMILNADQHLGEYQALPPSKIVYGAGSDELLATVTAKLTIGIENTAGKQVLSSQEDQANRQRNMYNNCLLYTSPSPRDQRGSRMPSSA